MMGEMTTAYLKDTIAPTAKVLSMTQAIAMKNTANGV